jgi:GNAT superfamily N-acetyltransferase
MVDKECRNQGVGTALYKAFCRAARKCGYEDVTGSIGSQAAFHTRKKVFGEPHFVSGEPDDLKGLPACLISLDHFDTTRMVEVTNVVPKRCPV